MSENQGLLIRDITSGDEEALKKILSDSWKIHEQFNESGKNELGLYYLYNSLKSSTYAKVAVKDNVVLGVVMANSFKEKLLKSYQRKAVSSFFHLLFMPQGLSILSFFHKLNKIDKKLSARTKENYGGEWTLWIVDHDYRHQGIGKILYDNVMSYLKSEGITKFFFYTDTDCDYEFYDQNGYTRREEEKHVLKINHKDYPMTFFIYDNKELGKNGGYDND